MIVHTRKPAARTFEICRTNASEALIAEATLACDPCLKTSSRRSPGSKPFGPATSLSNIHAALDFFQNIGPDDKLRPGVVKCGEIGHEEWPQVFPNPVLATQTSSSPLVFSQYAGVDFSAALQPYRMIASNVFLTSPRGGNPVLNYIEGQL